MPRGIPSKPKVKIEEAKKESWTPAPDMGDIKPPVEGEKVCALCSHKKAVHYGPTKDWCNTTGCNCQGHK